MIRNPELLSSLALAAALAAGGCEKASPPSEPASRPALVAIDAAPFATTESGAVVGGTFRVVAMTPVGGERTAFAGPYREMAQRALEADMRGLADSVDLESIEMYMQFAPGQVTITNIMVATIDGERQVCRVSAASDLVWRRAKFRIAEDVHREATSRPKPVLRCEASLDASLNKIQLTDEGIDMAHADGVVHMVHAELPPP